MNTLFYIQMALDLDINEPTLDIEDSCDDATEM